MMSLVSYWMGKP